PFAVARDRIEHECERHLARESEVLAEVARTVEEMTDVAHLDALKLRVFRQTRKVSEPRLGDQSFPLTLHDARDVHLLFGKTELRRYRLSAFGRDQCLKGRRIRSEDRFPSHRLL